jgi:hypothetical protein
MSTAVATTRTRLAASPDEPADLREARLLILAIYRPFIKKRYI